MRMSSSLQEVLLWKWLYRERLLWLCPYLQEVRWWASLHCKRADALWLRAPGYMLISVPSLQACWCPLTTCTWIHVMRAIHKQVMRWNKKNHQCASKLWSFLFGIAKRTTRFVVVIDVIAKQTRRFVLVICVCQAGTRRFLVVICVCQAGTRIFVVAISDCKATIVSALWWNESESGSHAQIQEFVFKPRLKRLELKVWQQD